MFVLSVTLLCAASQVCLNTSYLLLPLGSFLYDVGTKEIWSEIVFFSFLFFLAPYKKEAKKLSGSTYVFGVRSRSSVSLAVVSQINVLGRHDRVSKLASLRSLKQLTRCTSLRRIAYFASDSLMNQNPLREFQNENKGHSTSQKYCGISSSFLSL